MDKLREKLQEIPEIHPQVVNNGRFSTPRIIFYFDQCPKQFRNTYRTAECNINKLEYNIEDRIFRILRTLRIITNNSDNSLFAVPANTPFVYVNDTDVSDDYRIDLDNFFANIRASRPIKAPDFPFSVTTNYARKDRCFHNFLRKHIDLAMQDGFNDNISNARGLPRTYFEVFFFQF